jgi:hypothetical protein
MTEQIKIITKIMTMMMKNHEAKEDEIIYRTSPGIRPNVSRVLAIIVIIICVAKFHINTTFFSVLIAFTILWLFSRISYKIKVKETEFVICKYVLFFTLISNNRYKYTKLSKVVFHNSEIEWGSTIFFPVPTSSGKTLDIFFKDSSEKKIERVFLKWDDVRRCMTLINERIQN